MTRQQLHLVNNHLTLELINGETVPGRRALLEQLCTDDIYSVKDDFDRGFDANLWVVKNMTVADHDPFGVIYSDAPEGAVGSNSLIRSRLANFYPDRRATFQARAILPRDGSHVELGFVKEDHSDDTFAVMLAADAGVAVNARSFGLAVRSPNISGWSVVSGGSTTSAINTNRTAVTTRVSETGWTTFLVAVNEQGETRVWINGQHDNTFAQRTDMHVTRGHYLWINVPHGSLAVDYIQAWEERVPL